MVHKITKPYGDLQKVDHNGHVNEEESDFDPCYPLIIHAESEEELEEIAEHISEEYGEE